MEAVVNVAGVVPAENAVAFAVSETVFNQNLFVHRGKLIELIRGELSIELIEDPGYGTLRDEPRGNQAVADFIVDKAQLGVRMNHEKILSIFWGKFGLPAEK